MMETSQLVARAQKGDRAALEALLSAVAPQVERFGRRMCGRAGSDADDVVQERLLAVVRHLPDFEGRSSLSSWVFTLARTACTRKRRGLKNRPPVADDAAPEPWTDATPEDDTARAELTQLLGRALDAMPEEYREAVQLRDVEGLSAREASTALGISEAALKSRLHRARVALRDALAPALGEAPPSSQACPDIAAAWSRKLEDELDDRDCAAMEAHLASCRRCSAACDAFREVLFVCKRAGASEVTPELRAKVREAIRASGLLD